MVRAPASVVVLAVDKWGPFKDDPHYGTPEARTIPYVTIVGSEGGRGINATLVPEVDPGSIPVMRPVALDLEFYANDRGLIKARCHGVVKGA